jgi:hypothetical protein
MPSNMIAYQPHHSLGHRFGGGGGHHESAIARFFTHNPIFTGAKGLVMGHGSTARHRALEGGHILRQGLESAAAGSFLAMVHVELPHGGLDQKVGKWNLPIDGLVAIGGYGASMWFAGHDSGLSADFRNVASSALGVLAFRKTFAFASAKKLHAGHAVGGAVGPGKPAGIHGDRSTPIEFGREDPIVAAARAL